uniref:Uncharacterized protein n=1 Tax=Anopheles merus TaxID=30066 RepID=A0A182UU66_ANOME
MIRPQKSPRYHRVGVRLTLPMLGLSLATDLLRHRLRSSGSSSKGSSPPNNGLVPRFISRGHTYRAVVGDTLVLPCEVENLAMTAHKMRLSFPAAEIHTSPVVPGSDISL